jgi:PAS domain S-box-containing protein
MGEYFARTRPFAVWLGMMKNELAQLNYFDLNHPNDRRVGQELFQDLVEGKRDLYTLERRYRHKDGNYVWGRVTGSRIIDQDEMPLLIIAMIEDIAERKQIEQELIEMRRRLMHSRENERLRLAQELHDSPLQDIIGLSFQVQGLLNELTDGNAKQELNDMQETLQLIAVKMRTIAGELRPPALAPFGLHKAIQSHIENFQKNNPSLQVNLHLAHGDQLLPEDTRLALFRIYQESLNNIVRHSKANQVWIRLILEEERVILEVEDDGQGFELPARWIQLARGGHLGLVGARERTEAVGGQFEVLSSPGEGTFVRAIVPRNGSGDN